MPPGPTRATGRDREAVAAAGPVGSGRGSGGVMARHVVRRSDTLTEISTRYYGTMRRWRDIYDANRGKIPNPDLLPEGVTLVIPR